MLTQFKTQENISKTATILEAEKNILKAAATGDTRTLDNYFCHPINFATIDSENHLLGKAFLHAAKRGNAKTMQHIYQRMYIPHYPYHNYPSRVAPSIFNAALFESFKHGHYALLSQIASTLLDDRFNQNKTSLFRYCLNRAEEEGLSLSSMLKVFRGFYNEKCLREHYQVEASQFWKNNKCVDIFQTLCALGNDDSTYRQGPTEAQLTYSTSYHLKP